MYACNILGEDTALLSIEILTHSHRGGLVLVKSSLPTASHVTVIHSAQLYPLKYNETCVYNMTWNIISESDDL
jgi:hypothetical protein